MASIQHRRAELYGIEAKATHGAWQDIEDTPSEAEIETSKAISAKRQADALERIADAFDQQAEAGNVVFWLARMATDAR